MKTKKKAAALCGILAGALVFSTAALADVKLGNGYDSLKTAIKTTSAKAANEFDNYTVKANYSLLIDGKEINGANSVTKYDRKNQIREMQNDNVNQGEKSQEYSFSSKGMRVYKDNNTEKYQVYKYTSQDSDDSNGAIYTDVFKEEYAQDVEKLADAFVGNLKDTIQTEEKDGKTLYMGDLTETQVPTTINALTSFAFKYGYLNNMSEDSSSPSITKDIYVKEASGKALKNQDGVLENVLASATLVGKDDNGKEHVVSMNLSVSLEDINNTKVSAPQLTAENSEETTEDGGITVLDSRYVGSYVATLIDSNEKGFYKAGERHFVIDSVDKDGHFTGKFYENYTDAAKQKTARSFAVSGKVNTDGNGGDVTFTYTENGEQKNGIIYITGANGENLSLSFDVKYNQNHDGWESADDEYANCDYMREFH